LRKKIGLTSLVSSLTFIHTSSIKDLTRFQVKQTWKNIFFFCYKIYWRAQCSTHTRCFSVHFWDLFTLQQTDLNYLELLFKRLWLSTTNLLTKAKIGFGISRYATHVKKVAQLTRKNLQNQQCTGFFSQTKVFGLSPK